MENNEEVELKKKEEGGCKHRALAVCHINTARRQTALIAHTRLIDRLSDRWITCPFQVAASSITAPC